MWPMSEVNIMILALIVEGEEAILSGLSSIHEAAFTLMFYAALIPSWKSLSGARDRYVRGHPAGSTPK
jgi:hypothetical protein